MVISLFESREKLLRICCLLLVLATVALYNPLSRAPFLNYDDDAYVVQNSHLRGGLNWNTVTWAFTTHDLSNWHPLTWLSHALDVRMFGLKPEGHHYVNVLFQALNVVLLFLLLERCTGALWRSFMVAALFAVHPINVESVAWISERKNVLSMAFFLLGLLAYVSYVRKVSIVRYLAVFFCFACGLMAKPQVITFPFVLLLMDYWPLQRVASGEEEGKSGIRQRHFSWLVVEKIPLFALSLASALITMKVQTDAIHLELPFRARLENALISYVEYLWKFIWPVDLAPLYPHPMLHVSASRAAMAGLLLVLITILVMVGRKQRYIPVGWFWFLGTMVPMIGLVQVGVQSMADRYAYIPFIGLLIALCWGAADLMEQQEVPWFVTAVMSAVVLAGFGGMCYRQVGYWDDNLKLWSHTLEITHDNYIAEDCMATALLAEGRIDDAAEHLRSAVRINPQDPLGNLNLAFYEQQHRKFSEAIERYDAVLRLTGNPRLLATALTDRGYAFYSQKEYAEAQKSFEAALHEFPEESAAMIGMGLVTERSGKPEGAATFFTRAVELQPSDQGYLLLAQALDSAGKKDAAQAARERAGQISRNLNQAEESVRKLLAD